MAMIFLLESVFGDNTGSTYKSVTERNAAYVTNCLGRWINKIEDECSAKLLSERQKKVKTYCYKMDTGCMFKHDKQAIAQYTSSLFQQGAVTPNEIRELHGLPPHDGGDKLPSEVEQERADQALEIAQQSEDKKEDNSEKAVPEKDDQSTPDKEPSE
jgi:phage portal protein BeeE